jgi:hypothetical protein
MMPFMKNQLRKILSFSLLLTGCIPVAFTLFFLIRQEMIQHEMKEKLEWQSLHIITLAADDVRWVNKKEIWVDGKMFDVKSFSLKDGQYEFTGLFDEEETALAEQLKNKARQHNEPGNSPLAQLFQWLQAAYLNNATMLLSPGEAANLKYCFPPPDLTSPFKIIFTPPPRV